MANDSVGVAAAASPTNYIDNESIATGGSPAAVDRQRVRVGGAGYTDLADVVTGDTGQGAQVVAGSRLEVAVSSGSNVALASTDCSNYRCVAVHLTAKATGATVTFQQSNDNVNWVNVGLGDASGATANTSPAAAVNTIYLGALSGRYFRLNQTGASAGTTTGRVEFFAAPSPPAVQRVSVENVTNPITVTAANFASADNLGAANYLAVTPTVYNGSNWDRPRTPTTFKTATATASGDTALWTPTAGKKFRIMRYMIEVTSNAARASGGLVEIVLRDSTTALGFGHSLFAPASAITTFQPGDDTGWVDLGNGYLSTAANNVLNINLSVALSAGEVRVVVCGTEE